MQSSVADLFLQLDNILNCKGKYENPQENIILCLNDFHNILIREKLCRVEAFLECNTNQYVYKTKDLAECIGLTHGRIDMYCLRKRLKNEKVANKMGIFTGKYYLNKDRPRKDLKYGMIYMTLPAMFEYIETHDVCVENLKPFSIWVAH